MFIEAVNIMEARYFIILHCSVSQKIAREIASMNEDRVRNNFRMVEVQAIMR